MITETSLLAYNNIDIPKAQKSVLEALKTLKFATNSMISRHLGWSINRVTPRVYELRKKGNIEFSHISWCPVTRNKAKYWKIG